MSEQENSVKPTKEKDFIFRNRMIPAAIVLVGMYGISFIAYDELANFLRMCVGTVIHERIAIQSMESLYDTQITLLSTILATLTIVTSIIDQRYLGANYKHWFFKYSPYLFTPQEIILLMVINQFGGLLHVLTGGYKLLAFLSFLICWCLFLYLMYQIYVYSVKVSYVLRKVRKQMVRYSGKPKFDDMFDRIYDKLMSMRYTDSNNSYLTDEVVTIIQMMFLYCRSAALDLEKIQDLKNVILNLINNQARYLCNRNTHINSTKLDDTGAAAIECAYRGLVEKILDEYEDHPKVKDGSDKYCNKKTAEVIMNDVLSMWLNQECPDSHSSSTT